MKKELTKAINRALNKIAKEFEISLKNIKVEIKENRERKFGDYSTNVAMVAAKTLLKPPSEVAELVKRELITNDTIRKIEIAGPGFINFYLYQNSRTKILQIINSEKQLYGFKSPKGSKRRVLIEYVSSNPTGPLHVGHARGAAFGSVLSNILRAVGFKVDEEYYINDRGRQMDILALSVWIRYLQHLKVKINFPESCYKGDYVKFLAKDLSTLKKDKYLISKDIQKNLPKNSSTRVNQDKHLDEIIKFSKNQLKDLFEEIKTLSLDLILKNIKTDLKNFGVNQNLWFKESSLFKFSKEQPSQIEKSIQILDKNNYIYHKEGAVWFKSTRYKDDKDRVVKRKSGETTYFASDIAYHLNKFQRGYDKILNIWGADHHGYLPRVKAAISALKENSQKFEVIFIQFASLIRKGKKVSMSTRGGEFITLNQLMKEVTPEAARFFFINRKGHQHLNFDLDLTKEQSKDNPLYYIQYGHARICSVFNKLASEKRAYKEKIALENLILLDSSKETEILQLLTEFPDIIERAAKNYEPHLVCYYLRELAAAFHSYYNSEKVLVEEEGELQAKLYMLSAIRQVIFNGLTLLNISAPESM